MGSLIKTPAKMAADLAECLQKFYNHCDRWSPMPLSELKDIRAIRDQAILLAEALK